MTLTSADIGSLWLTQITLNARHPTVAGELHNAKSLIDRVMGLFPGASRQPSGEWDRAALGILYRVGETGDGSPFVMLQSATPPDADSLPESYGTMRSTDFGSFVAGLDTGMSVNYRITVNATSRDADGKRRALSDHDIDQWWLHQAKRKGLGTTDHTQTRHSDLVTGKMRVVLTQIDGHATITDVHAVRDAVLNGIGPAKAYGAGLLSLAR